MIRFLKRHPIWFSILLLIILLVAALVVRARMPKPLPVKTAPVERKEEIKAIVTAPGEIRAHEMVDIQAEVAGVIVELPVREGQSVKRGDVLLKIDPVQVSAEVAGARARYAAGEAEIKRMDSLIASAQANLVRQKSLLESFESDLAEARIAHDRDLSVLKRYQDLLKTKTISPEEFEVVEARAKISSQRIVAAQARIDQAKADINAGQLAIDQQKTAKAIAQQDRAGAKAVLDRAEDQLSKVTILSPLDGVIAQLNVEVGERAVPGIQSNPQATLMTIANMSVIEAEIQVDESDIIRVKHGQQADIEVDALPDQVLHGKVEEIGSMPIRETSGNQEGKDFKVVVAIEAPPATLRVGMSCETKITVGTRRNVLAVPIQALTTREVDVDDAGKYLPPPRPSKSRSASKKQPAAPSAKSAQKPDKKELQGVFVIGEGNLAHFKTVKAGIMGEMDVEIEGGLADGERVIIGPLKSQRMLEEWKFVKETDKFEEE